MAISRESSINSLLEIKPTGDGLHAGLSAQPLTRVSDRASRCTAGEALRRAVDHIRACSASPRLDAELLMAHVRGTSRASVLAHLDAVLERGEQANFENMVNRRAVGEPVAYIRSMTAWWDMELSVSPAVLIPRPDTEVVVERTLWRIRRDAGATVVDVGTGSGAIAIAIARSRPDVAIIAIDVSPHALAVAETNVRRYGLDHRIQLVLGNLLEPVQENPSAIVANLPYLSADMMVDLSPDVRSEPHLALFGGSDGLDLYRAMFLQYRERGWHCPMICEIDPRQSERLVREIHTLAPGASVGVWPDLAGRARAVEIWR